MSKSPGLVGGQKFTVKVRDFKQEKIKQSLRRVIYPSEAVIDDDDV